eukprot:c12287_g1_i1.p1 GENE.c12287_g1_i1~~c12287_g1_i1.p1  ORF type:complete len:145 (+),score=9.04 c12287_g1_i1:183-617(+)
MIPTPMYGGPSYYPVPMYQMQSPPHYSDEVMTVSMAPSPYPEDGMYADPNMSQYPMPQIVYTTGEYEYPAPSMVPQYSYAQPPPQMHQIMHAPTPSYAKPAFYGPPHHQGPHSAGGYVIPANGMHMPPGHAHAHPHLPHNVHHP